MMKYLPAITPAHGDSIAHLLDTVQCVDAFDLLDALPDASVDMVLCDLPYGVTACKWDTPLPLPKLWDELRRVTKTKAAIVLTATQPFASRLVSSNYEMFHHEWVWDKHIPRGMSTAKYKPMQKHELVLVFAKDTVNYYPIMTKREQAISGKVYGLSNVNRLSSTDGKLRTYTHKYPESILTYSNHNSTTGSIHPTQKPVALFEYLIKTYTRPGEVVLDMTCGSGTTAVAARNTERRFICGDNGTCERTGKTWAAIARERLQNTDPMQDSLPDEGGFIQQSLFGLTG